MKKNRMILFFITLFALLLPLAAYALPINTLSIGGNGGTRAGFQAYDLDLIDGNFSEISSATIWNAMSVAQIAATTDVLLITAFTSNAFALSATKLQALLEAGVGIIYEDYTRMSRVSHLVQTTPTTGGGAEIINPNNKPEITEFTQGITNQFLYNTFTIQGMAAECSAFAQKIGTTAATDVFCDVGAGMIIGHDNNQVGVFGFPGARGNQANLLANQIQFLGADAGPAQPIPEPATLVSLATGGALLFGLAKRRKRQLSKQ